MRRTKKKCLEFQEDRQETIIGDPDPSLQILYTSCPSTTMAFTPPAQSPGGKECQLVGFDRTPEQCVNLFGPGSLSVAPLPAGRELRQPLPAASASPASLSQQDRPGPILNSPNWMNMKKKSLLASSHMHLPSSFSSAGSASTRSIWPARTSTHTKFLLSEHIRKVFSRNYLPLQIRIASNGMRTCQRFRMPPSIVSRDCVCFYLLPSRDDDNHFSSVLREPRLSMNAQK